MSDIIPFSFENYSIRAVIIDGNPWLVGKDVAEALGYANHNDAITRHCKGVVKRYPLQTPGGMQEVRVINEPDAYRLITGSTLPEAVRSEKWLFEDVLPSIRKTGGYSLPGMSHTGTDPRFIEASFSSCLNIARLCGFNGNMALLSADNGTKVLTGLSALALIGATHLLADERGRTYTPTDLGKLMDPPLTPVKMNLLLEASGLQRKELGGWLPTDEAEGLFEWADTGKRHSTGVPVKQLRWFRDVLDHLAPTAQRLAA